MQKVNISPLNCFRNGCNTVPTIVLEFQDPRRTRIKGQIITCVKDKDLGIQEGNRMFGRNILLEHEYPSWLKRLHDEVLLKGTIEGNPVGLIEIERLRIAVDSAGELREVRNFRTFGESRYRRSPERR